MDDDYVVNGMNESRISIFGGYPPPRFPLCRTVSGSQKSIPPSSSLSSLSASPLPPSASSVSSASFSQFINCTMPDLMESERYTVSVYGHVSTVIILLTVITNAFVCLVLLRKNMRNPTNLLLVAMAISDTLTGVFPVPTIVYFYTLGHYRDYTPYTWCRVNPALLLHLPTITHTASIWLTVALAAQRYIYVCRSQRAKAFCTVPNVLKSIAVIYVVAVASQVIRFFEYNSFPVELSSKLHDYEDVASSEVNGGTAERKMIIGCYTRWTPFVERHTHVYFSVYWWFRVVFIHLIPCTLLVILNALLFHTMRSAKARHDLLLRQNRRSEVSRLAESNLATMMLVTVVGVFLLVEFPLAVLLITMIYENSFGDDHLLMSKEDRRIASLFINLFILLSYPANFFIYCGMSRQFRETFKRLFCEGGGAGGRSCGAGTGVGTTAGDKLGGGGRTIGCTEEGGLSAFQTTEMQMTRMGGNQKDEADGLGINEDGYENAITSGNITGND